MANKYLDYNGLAYFWEKIKAKFTALQNAKLDDITYNNSSRVLSKTKNGTSTDIVSVSTLKTDMGLGSVEAGAQVNVIEDVKVNGTSLTVSSKSVNIIVPSNAQENVIEDVKVNGASLTVTNKAVDVTVPTKVSDLTNDTGYITDAGVTGVRGSAESSEYRTGNVEISYANVGAAASIHSHGYITSDGRLLNSSQDAIDTGARLVFVDSSGNIRRANVTFNLDATSAAYTFLNRAGVFQEAVTGVKGSDESNYRTGLVNLSYSHVGAAPVSHEDSTTRYGAGNNLKYGHVKLIDATNLSDYTASAGGYAASPKAVADALTAAKSYADAIDTGVTGVKGGAESSYRKGQVNLTAANVGAAPTSHASAATTYGVGTTSAYGHVKVTTGNGLYISNGTISMNLANPGAAGAMSAADKTKLNKLLFDSNDLIDSSILPSYVDDVVEAYPAAGETELSSTWLATDSAASTAITPETGKIYVLMADSTNYAANTQFRWGGTAYVKLADGGVSSITNAEIDTITAA